MERSYGIIEQSKDKYDNELTQAQTDVIAVVDKLLVQRSEGSLLKYVDIPLMGEK